MNKSKKHLWILFLLTLVVTLGVGFAAVQAAEVKPGWYFQDIVNADFVAQYAKLPPPPNSMVIDVRPKEEYSEGHIFGSFSIPNNQPGELTRLLPKNKGTLLVFYGQDPANNLSHESARAAQKMGYTNIKVFAGGVLEWKKGFSLVALTKEAVAQGFGVVDYDYVRGKVGIGIRQLNQVVIIDARPDRMYSEGHIPSALSFPSMKFAQVYPDFEKLNIAKNTEIILGIGRECELSLKNAQRLKEKGYTNLKLYISPPVWLDNDYQEIDIKRAKEFHDQGVLFIDSRPETLFKKGSIEKSISIPVTKFEANKNILPKDMTKPIVSFCQGYSCVLSHEVARKLMDLGYQNVVVYAGGYPEWEKAFPSTASAIKPGSGEGTIDVAAFEKILKEDPAGILVIDVRSSAEFSTGALKTAVSIPVGDLEKKLKTLSSDKPIVFICSTGARSGEAFFMVKDSRPEIKNVFYLDTEMSFNKDGSYKIGKP